MAPAAGESPDAVGIVFSIATAETQMGEVLRVVGAGPLLGAWDTERSIALTTGPTTYPRWTSSVVWIARSNGVEVTLQYKYIRDCRAIGKGVHWEDKIPNRTVTLPPAAPMGKVADKVEDSVVWVIGDVAWDCQDASPPHLLDLTSSTLLSAGGKGFVATPRRGHEAVKDVIPLPVKGLQPPKPAAEEAGTPEWSAGRATSPEWGGDSGDAIVTGGVSLFTPSARGTMKKTPSKGTPMMSPSSSSSLMQRLVSNSLLPECEGDREEDAQVMVREESASSLQNLGSDHGLLRVGSTCSSDGLMARTTSSSLLPDQFGAAVADAHRDDGEPSIPSSMPSFEDVYEIVGDDPIGEGSFGLVWNCLRKKVVRGGDDKRRAVKRISKARLQPRDVRNLFGEAEFEGEIRMHLRLKHKHIVAMHEVFDDVGIVSLVMECCSAGDLFDIITDRAAKQGTGLPEVAAARVLRHLMRALAFLHNLNIVHRDVKCENVLLLERESPIEVGTYKLCDFGFAKEQSSSGRHLRSRLGSPDTVAPEVVKGEEYSTPVDCWAAGVLLFMALSATPPFWANSDIGVLQRVKSGQYCFSHVRWEAISMEAKAVVQHLLAYNPYERLTAQQALELPWVKTRR